MGNEKKVARCNKIVFPILLTLVILIGSSNHARGYNTKETGKAFKGQGIQSLSREKNMKQGTPAGQTEAIKHIHIVGNGDSFFEILKANGLSGEEAITIVKKTRPVFNISKIKPGNEMLFVYSSVDRSLVEINYDISDLHRLVITISGDQIDVRKVKLDKEEHVIASTDSAPVRIDSLPAQQVKPGKAVRTKGNVQENGIEPVSQGCRQLDIEVKKGQSLSAILGGVGVGTSEIESLARSTKGMYNLRNLKQGRTLSIWLTRNTPTSVQRLTYEMNDTTYLDVSRHHGSFLARTGSLTLDVRYESAQGTIRSSLYDSAVAGGINPEIVNKLVDVFENDINFFSDIQPGDTYSVLFEKYYVKDQFRGYGRIVAARFINKGKELTAFSYANESKGIQGYYDENGCPLKKMFLQAPLNYRRISSGFSYHRTHPIFGVVRPHLGIDYAAPTGTQVRSLGPGKVIRMGWDGGMGKAIRVMHPGGYVSIYGHLSRFAKGVSVGTRVNQGDAIAYVGMTGNTTGPHLHFMISSNNKYINPLKMKNVNGPALRGSALADFKHLTTIHRLAMLENRGRNVALSHHDKKTAPL